MNLDLSFDELNTVNVQRAKRWHPGFPNAEDGWVGSDWSNAMCGEAGEAANVVKKLRRLETGLKQAAQGDLSNQAMESQLLEKLSKEIGDVIIYADLLATYYDLDLGACVAYAFNQVSEREGFPERLRNR